MTDSVKLQSVTKFRHIRSSRVILSFIVERNIRQPTNYTLSRRLQSVTCSLGPYGCHSTRSITATLCLHPLVDVRSSVAVFLAGSVCVFCLVLHGLSAGGPVLAARAARLQSLAVARLHRLSLLHLYGVLHHQRPVMLRQILQLVNRGKGNFTPSVVSRAVFSDFREAYNPQISTTNYNIHVQQQQNNNKQANKLVSADPSSRSWSWCSFPLCRPMSAAGVDASGIDVDRPCHSVLHVHHRVAVFCRLPVRRAAQVLRPVHGRGHLQLPPTGTLQKYLQAKKRVHELLYVTQFVLQTRSVDSETLLSERHARLQQLLIPNAH